MPTDVTVAPNVKQAVPFFNVTDIEASLRFYLGGVGFVLTNQWVPIAVTLVTSRATTSRTDPTLFARS